MSAPRLEPLRRRGTEQQRDARFYRRGRRVAWTYRTIDKLRFSDLTKKDRRALRRAHLNANNLRRRSQFWGT